MREEKRRRTFEDEGDQTFKKRRDGYSSRHTRSPSPHSTKSRGHLPVSERQQFALLKQLETKESSSSTHHTSSKLYPRGTRSHKSSSSNERFLNQEIVPCEHSGSTSTSSYSPAFSEQFPSSSTKSSSRITSTSLAVPSTTESLLTPTQCLSQAVGPLVSNMEASNAHSIQRHQHHSSQQFDSETKDHGVIPTSKNQLGAPTSVSNNPSHLTHSSDSSGFMKKSSSSNALLMKAAKNGDLDLLKVIVKDGVNINEKDASENTALHECCSRNHSRLVAYLLRHNADPNAKGFEGNTPLHEAALAGNVRVINLLLRHDADVTIPNFKGDRPIDISHNEATAATLREFVRSSDLAQNSGSPCISSKSKRTSSSSFSKSTSHSKPSPNNYHGHELAHHRDSGSTPNSNFSRYESKFQPRRLSIPSSLGIYTASSASSESDKLITYSEDTGQLFSSSTARNSTSPPIRKESLVTCDVQIDPSCSASVSLSSLTSMKDSNSLLPPSLSTVQTTTCRTSPTERVFEPIYNNASKQVSKKDPYAFDDEEPDNIPTALHPLTIQDPHISSHIGIASAVGFDDASLSSFRRYSAGSSNFSLLPAIHVPTSNEQATPSSLSPNGGNSAPSLKLRFAKEAGHYTLMEQQQLQQEHLAELQHQKENSRISSCDSKSSSPLIQLIAESSHQKAAENEALVLPLVNSSNIGAAPFELGSTMRSITSNHQDATLTSEGSAPALDAQESLDNHQPSITADQNIHKEVTEFANQLKVLPDDDCKHRSQKVPPLRIKLASGGISDSTLPSDSSSTEPLPDQPIVSADSLGKHSSNESPQQSFNLIDLEVKIEPVSDSLSSEMTEVPLSEATLPSKRRAHHSVTSLTSMSKCVTPMNTNDSTPEEESKHEKIKTISSEPSDFEAKDEDLSQTRSSRTLRSHTAALREREERERNASSSSTKKRNSSPQCENDGGLSTLYSHNHDFDNATVEIIPLPDFGLDFPETDFQSHIKQSDGHHLYRYSRNVEAPDAEEIQTSVAPEETPSAPTVREQTIVKVFDDPLKSSSSAWGENPYDKAVELNAGFSHLISKLVELQPKEPTGYQDYLLVTHDYLLSGRIPQHLAKRPCPVSLDSNFSELFEEQEEERFAQALKHQSEREQLRLCAEQAVLCAQTRATIALANQPQPLSFCSVIALDGLTYLPSVKDSEHKDDENITERFEAGTLLGWLQTIKDDFVAEKKKVLCRQLHEAESLMMVQKLDWEVKLKELHIRDCRANIFDEIPVHHVPTIDVPRDFPLFVHDPIQRTS